MWSSTIVQLETYVGFSFPLAAGESFVWSIQVKIRYSIITSSVAFGDMFDIFLAFFRIKVKIFCSHSMFGKSIDLDVSQAILDRLQSRLFHRSDSIQCQYRLFLLNLRFFRTNIENLKQQIGRDINRITFRKFLTSLVQKLKILGVYQNCESR